MVPFIRDYQYSTILCNIQSLSAIERIRSVVFFFIKTQINFQPVLSVYVRYSQPLKFFFCCMIISSRALKTSHMRACECIICDNRPLSLCHEPPNDPFEKAQNEPHGSFEVICGSSDDGRKGRKYGKEASHTGL